MAAACPYPTSTAPVLSSLADYLDCHARGLGEVGFQSLASGPVLPAVLTGCLTLYVALIGYRLALGASFQLKDAVLAVLRIGLVVTFCTRWPSYEAVFYRVAMDGPAELTASTLTPSGPAVLGVGESAQRLENAYRIIERQTLAAAPAKPPPQRTTNPSSALIPGASALPSPPPAPPPDSASQDPPINPAGIAFMVCSLGGMLAVRFAAGMLLALGPLIIALALFDVFLGMFEGWIRALAGVAFGGFGASVVTALELGFVEGRLADAGPEGAFSEESLMVTALVFFLVTLGVLTAAGVLAWGFRLRPLSLRFPQAATGWPMTPAATASAPGPLAKPPATAAPSRARAVADSIVLRSRRDEMNAGPSRGPAVAAGPFARTPASHLRDETRLAAAPLGQSLRRGLLARRTLSAARRDAGQ
jgi:type IV secretion system protein VirB6